MENFNIILPAAGIGCRLKSSRPKILSHFIDDEYLWEKQINTINAVFNNPNITFILGFEHQKIIKKIKNYAHIIINTDFEETNVAYSISLGLKENYENSLI